MWDVRKEGLTPTPFAIRFHTMRCDEIAHIGTSSTKFEKQEVEGTWAVTTRTRLAGM